ncbi:MAG: flagellin [Deltaproteobacteria bacterium]|jgi:flagellin|nr:flagellin [Deltaproteobacteria bacterium]
MTFRVNHNISALNTHRFVQNNYSDLSNSLERLSSGLKINRAADGPAALAISEHLRSQVVGLNQAIENSETAVSILQTTESNMVEITGLLNGVRQLVIHALNEGANDKAALIADQKEIDAALKTIEEIATNARFAGKHLLDGSNGVSGSASGEGLEYISATTNTKDAREKGFEVRLKKLACRSHITGTAALTDEMVKAGERLVLIENGKQASYKANQNDTVETTVRNLRSLINKNGLDVSVELTEAGLLKIHHNQYGADHKFQVSSSSAGVLSSAAGKILNVDNGQDIEGTINGESAIGEGRYLTGIEGAACTDGLKIRYLGKDIDSRLKPDCEISDMVSDEAGAANDDEPDIPPEGISVGRVYLSQNSMKFQVGGNRSQMIDISLRDMKPGGFATGIANKSGFSSLADIQVTDAELAQDALSLVDVAINQIASERGKLGAFQKNSLETNLSNLRVANENLISSESIIRDVDMAKEMAIFTRNEIKSQSSSAMLAQANQQSDQVMKLLE